MKIKGWTDFLEKYIILKEEVCFQHGGKNYRFGYCSENNKLKSVLDITKDKTEFKRISYASAGELIRSVKIGKQTVKQAIEEVFGSISWDEFLERYLLYDEEFMLTYHGSEYWLSFHSENNSVIAELNVKDEEGRSFNYEYESGGDLLNNARIEGKMIKEIWEELEK